MTNKIKEFISVQLRKDLPDIRPGDKVRVWQKITEKDTSSKKEGEIKTRITPFEGIVIARKHGKSISSTITIRGEIKGIGVERIFPLHSPTIEKIEVLERYKVRRAKLYYLRGLKRRIKLKRKI